MDLTSIELIILDVDGVLTDGCITLTPEGEREKRFYVQDGCAIKLWQRCGGKIALLSGRGGEAVERRASELGITTVVTHASGKLEPYQTIVASSGVGDARTAYVGDDLPDLEPMARCAFPVAVANAASAVKRVAMYVTRRRGGHGAVAELVELLLRRQSRWSPQRLARA